MIQSAGVGGHGDPLGTDVRGDNAAPGTVNLTPLRSRAGSTPARQHQTPEQATWNLIFQRLDAFNLSFGRRKPVEVVRGGAR